MNCATARALARVAAGIGPAPRVARSRSKKVRQADSCQGSSAITPVAWNSRCS